VNDRFQTSQPHIYAVGDVIGFPSLASTSMEQGRLAACHAFGAASDCTPGLFPFGIYTIPEISMVGRTEEELTAAGVPYLANVFYFQAIDPGDTEAASVTDFQGQRKRLAKAADDRKKRLYDRPEVAENDEKPETKIADMLRVIMRDDGDDESWLRSIVRNA
jgi:hypothetical protein